MALGRLRLGSRASAVMATGMVAPWQAKAIMAMAIMKPTAPSEKYPSRGTSVL